MIWLKKTTPPNFLEPWIGSCKSWTRNSWNFNKRNPQISLESYVVDASEILRSPVEGVKGSFLSIILPFFTVVFFFRTIQKGGVFKALGKIWNHQLGTILQQRPHEKPPTHRVVSAGRRGPLPRHSASSSAGHWHWLRLPDGWMGSQEIWQM